jgi:hypothetical protein
MGAGVSLVLAVALDKWYYFHMSLGSRANRFSHRQANSERRHDVPEAVKNMSELEAGIRPAYEKAKSLIADARLDLDDYGHKVPAEQLLKDKAKVKGLSEKFSEDTLTVERMGAAITEASIYRGVNDHGWFGPDARAYVASEYDDFVNGTDLIFEFKIGENEYFSMAIDATLGQGEVLNKARRIKSEIDRGSLKSLSYFEAEEGKIGLDMVPSVIVQIDSVTAARLGKLLVNENDAVFRENPVQLRVLKDVQEQLRLYREYAGSTGKADIVEKYDRTLAIIDKEISLKEKSIQVPEDGSGIRNWAVDRIRRAGIFTTSTEPPLKNAIESAKSRYISRKYH